MIVDVAAYLLIANAALGLVFTFALNFGQSIFGYRVPLGLIALYIGIGVLGFALRRRLTRARWVMLGPGFLAPLGMVLGILLLAAAVFLSGVSVEGTIAGRRIDATGMARTAALLSWLTLISGALTCVVNFKLFRYLISSQGRAEFKAANENLVGAVFGSIAVWVLAVVAADFGEVRISREHLPGFLQTESMREGGVKYDAAMLKRSIKEAVRTTAFSGDSRHLVIAPQGQPLRLVVIDLESGKATRPDLKLWGYFRDAGELEHALAPDASSFLTFAGWVSLSSGKTTQLGALAPDGSNLLGFHSPSQFLIYNWKSSALEVIDLADNRVVHSVSISDGKNLFLRDDRQVRGDPLQGWSPARDRFTWMNRDGTVATLTLATGQVRSGKCASCRADGPVHVADDGNSMVATRVIDGSDGNQRAADVFDLVNDSETEVSAFSGTLHYFAGTGAQARALLDDFDTHRLTYRRVAGGGGWYIEPGERMTLLSAKGGEHLLFGDYSSNGGHSSYWLARFDAPPEHTGIQLREIRPATVGLAFRALSSDGRFALFMNGAGQLEIIDLSSIEEIAPVSYTMNFVDDEKLVAAQPFLGSERRVFSWRLEVPAEPGARDAPLDVPPGTGTRAAAGFNAENTQAPVQVSPGETNSSREVLKCRDSTGATIYTQGHCPPGTSLIEGTARQ